MPSCLRAFRCSAFTLIELLVVIGLIVLLLAIAVPAFNLINGSRSVEGATNQLSAMLGQIRADAINQQSPAGVLFFYDQAASRTRMIPVQRATHNAFRTANPQTGTPMSYQLGDFVKYTIGGADRSFVYKSLTPGNAAPTGAAGDPNWAESGLWFVDLAPDRDSLDLPPGVGAQCIYNDPNSFDLLGNPTGDRYIRQCGLLMFDGTGKLTSVVYGIHPYSKLGQRLAMAPNDLAILNSTTAYNPNFRSQFGLVLYDLESAKNAVPYRERDCVATMNSLSGITPPTDPPAYTANSPEYLEEAWLDANATPLLVNRYNGTLVKGE
ncbi:MAG: pilus assembly FimT family protein [Tepidisphaeraceae bacterium]